MLVEDDVKHTSQRIALIQNSTVLVTVILLNHSQKVLVKDELS